MLFLLIPAVLACLPAAPPLTVVPLPATPPVVTSELLAFRVDTVARGLDVPWALAFLPGGDLLVTERSGALRLVHDGHLDPRPIGGVPAVRARGQGGLFDVALHPDYARNGWIYLTYALPDAGNGTTALMRARLRNHALVDQQVLFQAAPAVAAAHHYGGRIAFDGRGYLYLSVGDRGGQDNAQRLDNHRGKVLRLNDDGTVPGDNPFVRRTGARPEIFSYGHRNPQGMALHPATGRLWTHEHGPQGGDEVNIIGEGRNYGWPAITYGINYDNTVITPDTARPGMEQPVVYWRPSIAPCGMAFVTADRYGPWRGNLLVGSLKFAYLNRCQVQGDQIVHQEKLLEGIGRVRAVEQSPDGFVYVAVEGPGLVVRLVPDGD